MPSADVCGDYTVGGTEYWANCTGNGQEVRYYTALQPGVSWVCTAPYARTYLGPGWNVIGAFATGRSC